MEHVSPKTCTWTKWFGLLLWPRLLHFPGLSITILLFLPLLVFKSLIWTGLRPFTFQVPQHLHSENTALSFTENHCYFGENLSFLFFLAFLGSRTSKRANLPPPFCSIVTMPSSWRSKSQKLDGFRRSQQQNAPAALLRSTPETSGNAQSDSVTEIMIQSCQFYHVQSNESGEIRETQEMSELAIAAKDNILSWAIHRTRTGSRKASPLVWRMALNRNQVQNSEILLEVKHPKVVFVVFQWPSSRRPWCSVAVHPLNIIGPGFLGFLGVRLLGCAPVARLLLIWLKQNLCIIETPQGLRRTNYAINNSEGKKEPNKTTNSLNRQSLHDRFVRFAHFGLASFCCSPWSTTRMAYKCSDNKKRTYQLDSRWHQQGALNGHLRLVDFGPAQTWLPWSGSISHVVNVDKKIKVSAFWGPPTSVSLSISPCWYTPDMI